MEAVIMKAQTKIKKILQIENELDREIELFKFIMKAIPRSLYQMQARELYFDLRKKRTGNA
jgi:hypothetical protein